MEGQTHQRQLAELVQAKGGFITSAEADAAGIPRVELTRAVRTGHLLRVERGVYRSTVTTSLAPAAAEALDLLEVQLRHPAARPCLSSALHLHGLTTTRPSYLQFAVPKNRRPLQSDEFLIETFYFSDQAYAEGTQHFAVRQRFLLTYTVEKTLIDLLRYAPKFGRDIYLEGLKKALKARLLDQRELTRLAKLFHVWPFLSQDLEVLNHDQDH